MSTLRETFVDLFRSLAQRPDEIMLDVGAGGERVIARIRVVLILLLLTLPVINLYSDGDLAESVAGFAGGLLAMVLAQLWLYLSKQPRRHRWLPFATGVSDISLVTLVLFLLVRVDPVAAINSQVVFACYVLAIMVTAMKNDGRATVLVGALAMLQYALLVLFVFATHGPDQLVSPEYGMLSRATQYQRLVLLLVATLLTAVVVYRMQRLVELSGTDGLTGLPNRSYFKLRFPELIEDARRSGQSRTLALIDLDRFKRINDHHGHLAGDRALRHLTSVLRAALGNQAPLVRIGGEEFVILFEQPMGPAWERMEALRMAVEARPFTPGSGEEPITITISVGLAAFPTDAAEVSGLMKVADNRLRQAKEGGRNRIVARDWGNAAS